MRIRGNPRVLLLLFFSFAVFFTGTLYETGESALSTRDPISLSTVLALASGLVFVLAILGRILWLTSPKATDQS